MDKLSGTKKNSIIRHYFSGLSYDEIAAKDGVSKGTVANIINDLKAGKFPEAADVGEHIEQLRELSLDLRRVSLTPGQCSVGVLVLSRINSCGLEPADIDRWPQILKSIKNDDDAQEFVRLIYSIQDVQQRTDLSLEALDNKVSSLEKKAAELEPVSVKLADCRKQLTALIKQRDGLASAVSDLEGKRKLLEPQVKELNKREQDLLRRIKDLEPKAQKATATLTTLNEEMEKLQNSGFNLETLAEFIQMVNVIAKRHAVKPDKLRARLSHELENLDKGLGLEELIKARKKELDEVEHSIKEANADLETARFTLKGLEQETTKIEVSNKETRETISTEMASIIPVTRDTINQFIQELHAGIEKAVGEVTQLRDKSLEVGKEVGRYQETLDANAWIKELLALVKGDDSIEAKKVRVIGLLVMRGISAWMRVWNKNPYVLTPLSGAINSLTVELERWKV